MNFSIKKKIKCNACDALIKDNYGFLHGGTVCKCGEIVSYKRGNYHFITSDLEVKTISFTKKASTFWDKFRRIVGLT